MFPCISESPNHTWPKENPELRQVSGPGWWICRGIQNSSFGYHVVERGLKVSRDHAGGHGHANDDRDRENDHGDDHPAQTCRMREEQVVCWILQIAERPILQFDKHPEVKCHFALPGLHSLQIPD